MRNNSSGRATSPKPKEVKNKPVSSTDLLMGLTAPSNGTKSPPDRAQGPPHGPVCATRAGYPLRATRAGYPLHRENRENGKKNSLSGKTQGIWKFCQNTGNFI